MVKKILQIALLSILGAAASFNVMSESRDRQVQSKVRGEGQQVRTSSVNMEGRIVYSGCEVNIPAVDSLEPGKGVGRGGKNWQGTKQFEILLDDCTHLISSQLMEHSSFSANEGASEASNARLAGWQKGGGEAWDWSDGNVVIRVAKMSASEEATDESVINFYSQYKVLKHGDDAFPHGIPMYFLINYP